MDTLVSNQKYAEYMRGNNPNFDYLFKDDNFEPGRLGVLHIWFRFYLVAIGVVSCITALGGESNALFGREEKGRLLFKHTGLFV